MTPFLPVLPSVSCSALNQAVDEGCALATKNRTVAKKCSKAFKKTCPAMKKKMVKEADWNLPQIC